MSFIGYSMATSQYARLYPGGRLQGQVASMAQSGYLRVARLAVDTKPRRSNASPEAQRVHSSSPQHDHVL